ncbi:hypothetical protein A2999_02985 [Candidatus Wolfebacteria bacterium RIFCSPLOWO2_01_FULL_38_11]|uniref:DOD-type homing endonuclease domain-containing protein n=1 Tax=Candidatus Wolfebacteria bacterium RIFCSPLOWO2_01_FULL_38_11 TaxID=1802556 RepID=A0A1F8DS21_9BACT|nr:MAG: hypothetical protein A2999_02985 [Candidatus Wolfebacteria bacterium RIFCSPLOWO2_01_FULL_38_11]
MPIYKTKNENFFKKWSPEMAYVSGFFAADGSMIKNKRGAYFIEFKSTDKEIINKIRKTIRANLAIGEYQPKQENHNKRYRLQIGSKEIFKDLLKLGMTPNKSLTLKMPKIPDKYFSHFIRGYFDGDGNVSISHYVRRARNNKKSITILSGFTCGSKKFLEKLFTKLKKITNISSGTLYYHSKGHRLFFSVKDSLILYKFMYADTTNNLFLSRKKKIFEKYFKLR